MAGSTKKALPGIVPSNALSANGIQSKAVIKYTQYLGGLFNQNFEILFFAGVEALETWSL